MVKRESWAQGFTLKLVKVFIVSFIISTIIKIV